MLRMIAKWMISRSIDEDRAIPGWIRRRIDGDQELKQFELRSRQLGERMKSDAAVWVATTTVPVAKPFPEFQAGAKARGSRNMVRLTSAWTFASAAAVVAVLTLNRPRQNPPDQAGQATNQSIIVTEPIVAADRESLDMREWMIRTVKKSRATLEELRSSARVLPIRPKELKLPHFSELLEPAKVAGSSTGHVYLILDERLATEQKLLVSELKSAYSFFTHRLPTGIVKLAGRSPQG